MAHKVIIEWTEKKIRDDYYQYRFNEACFPPSINGVDNEKAINKLIEKVDSMPIGKIIKDRKYLKSFDEYEMIKVMDDPYMVEIKVKGKK